MGLIAQSLYAKATPVYDEVESFKFQTLQVSVVSVMNCVGRISIGEPPWHTWGPTGRMLICIGIFTDFAKRQIAVRRAYCISLVAMLFFISQLVAMTIVDVKELWKASLLVGFSYGAMFGLFPTITIDWFGMCTS